MSNPGLGVMINMLCGNRGAEHLKEALGKTIANIKIEGESKLRFKFDDGSAIQIRDAGQSCCEHRWMHTDDDLNYFTGTTLMDAELREGPTVGFEYEPKESEFLIITTSKGQFTIVNYNHHNGYYGGFWIQVENAIE